MPKKKPKALPKELPYDGWSPLKQGVTQSLLNKFREDEDRFHKRAVLGYKEVDRKEALLYGTMFHKLIEIMRKLGPRFALSTFLQASTAYLKANYKKPEDYALGQIAIAQAVCYREWEKSRPKIKSIEQEPVFEEKYILPGTNFNPCPEISIRIPQTPIILRGRIDGVIEDDGMWIEENKTKSRINIENIASTIHCNIQVMFYALCAELKYGRPCKGVIYNIIRKPGQRIKKKESERQFIDRVVADIQAEPEYYFYRLKYQFNSQHLKVWEREELRPLLYKIYVWWKSIEKNPTNPWTDQDGNVNPFHGRRSFGMYDSLSTGKGEFFELIVNGNKRSVIVDREMFPELQDEED